MGTDATVCIPYRATPDRVAAYRRVRAFWKHHGFPVVTGDSGSETFNLAASRNAAVRKAKTRNVIVADADTIPDIEQVYVALDTSGITWPFAEYRHIPGECVKRSDLMLAPVDRYYSASVGGLFVCSVDDYWAAGGMDERFSHRSWGYDDSAFYLAARTFGLANRTSHGIVFSFNHSADRDMTNDNPHKTRYQLYRMCDGHPDLMRELIRGNAPEVS
jgi:glycosyltransferase involved in cell wall biosynthesis